MEDISKKYGISMQTLRMVKMKKEAADKSMNITQQIVKDQSPESLIPVLRSIIQKLHLQFMMAQKKSLSLLKVINHLRRPENNPQNLSYSSIVQKLQKLEEILPDNVKIVTMGSFKYLKFVCTSPEELVRTATEKIKK